VQHLAYGGIRTSLLFEAQTAATAAQQHDAMQAMMLPEEVHTVATQPATLALALRYADVPLVVKRALVCKVFIDSAMSLTHSACV
jgi:hypothetical protein